MIAVNIKPLVKGGEKIIIGGVMVPKPTTTTPLTDITKDYTRFIPPTTVVTSADGDLYLAPVPTRISDKNNIMPIQPRKIIYFIIYIIIYLHSTYQFNVSTYLNATK